MKYRIKEFNGVFTPQVYTDAFYCWSAAVPVFCMDLPECDSLEEAKVALDKFIRKDSPIYHPYP